MNAEITVYGRWLFLVDSASRPGLRHLVDFEPELDDNGNPKKGGEPYKCSCEAHYYAVTRPCCHVKAVLRFLRPVFKYMAAFPGATPVKVTASFDTKTQKGRFYTLDKNKTYQPSKPNDTTTPNPPASEWGLRARLSRQHLELANQRGPRLAGHAPRRRRKP